MDQRIRNSGHSAHPSGLHEGFQKERPPSTCFSCSNLLIPWSVYIRKRALTEKRAMRMQIIVSFPSWTKGPPRRTKQMTNPQSANNVSDVFHFLRVSANNRKLKMTAYKLQNALDSYILIITPLSKRKENNRKGVKEAERDNGEGERGHYLQKPSLEP